MPTPMAIMAVTCGAKLGTSSTWARICTTASPITMPARAATMGRPMASSEPNAIKRMTTAPSTPMTSLAGILNSPNIDPPSSTCSRDVLALAATSRMSAPSFNGTSLACTSNRISA